MKELFKYFKNLDSLSIKKLNLFHLKIIVSIKKQFIKIFDQNLIFKENMYILIYELSYLKKFKLIKNNILIQL